MCIRDRTFPFDLHERSDLDRHLVRMADTVAARLRKAEVVARTISIKVRFGDFTTLTRSITPPHATDSGTEIARHARELLDKIDRGRGIRLLGVGATGLDQERHRQLTLEDVSDEPDRSDWKLADEAVDEIRRRFGTDSIGPAVLAQPGDKLQTRDQNDKPWG